MRELKVGFTVPLKIGRDQLQVQDVWFEGPPAEFIPEECHLRLISDRPSEWIRFSPKNHDLKDGLYSWTNRYGEAHEMILKGMPLSEAAFSFQDRHFQLSDAKDSLSPFTPERIYLDVNRNWSEVEWDYILETYADHPVYVHHDTMMEVTEQNKSALFRQLRQKNFSCFPFFLMEGPETSLLIAKSTSTGPNLTDLRDSPFGKKLQAYLEQDAPPIRLLEMGNYSPLYKTFREFGLFNATQGTEFYSRELQDKQLFKAYLNGEQQVEIPGSKLLVKQVDSVPTGNAPDHLMRLFAYNHVLHQSGRDYFRESRDIPDHLIHEAEEAFVVTPVSSLVALETENDYKRFGIDKNQKGLKNASKHNSGAVPEPHEWALILIAGLILFGIYIRRIWP